MNETCRKLLKFGTPRSLRRKLEPSRKHKQTESLKCCSIRASPLNYEGVTMLRSEKITTIRGAPRVSTPESSC